MCYPLH